MAPHRFQAGMPRPANAGRRKGTPNKKTVRRQQLIDGLKASGKDPLSFFGDILSSTEAPLSLRFDAAKEMLPYMHPRLASIESRRGGQTHEERLEAIKDMLGRRQAIQHQRSTAEDLTPIESGSHVPTPRGGIRKTEGGGG